MAKTKIGGRGSKLWKTTRRMQKKKYHEQPMLSSKAMLLNLFLGISKSVSPLLKTDLLRRWSHVVSIPTRQIITEC